MPVKVHFEGYGNGFRAPRVFPVALGARKYAIQSIYTRLAGTKVCERIIWLITEICSMFVLGNEEVVEISVG